MYKVTEKLDWTHKNVKIKDIRKLSQFYIFIIKTPDTDIDQMGYDVPLMVKKDIFEERLKLYFLKDAHRISREEILGVNWNLYISKGYYIKIADGGVGLKHDMDPGKCYVSYLEIAGPLGSFESIYKETK